MVLDYSSSNLLFKAGPPRVLPAIPRHGACVGNWHSNRGRRDGERQTLAEEKGRCFHRGLALCIDAVAE